MLKVGITGGIATGKTTVSQKLLALGFPVIDCDRLVHENYREGGLLYRAVLDCFGPRILSKDGSIDRKALSQIVFADSSALESLNRITHPLVMKIVEEQIEYYRTMGFNLIFIDVPLLFEAKMDENFDYTVLVDSDDPIQLTRLMNRNGFSEDEAIRRIQAQMSMADKRKLANYILKNNGDLSELSDALEQLIFELKILEKKA